MVCSVSSVCAQKMGFLTFDSVINQARHLMPKAEPEQMNIVIIFKTIKSGLGAVVQALAFHQCSPGSIPWPTAIHGLSLLVIYSALGGSTAIFPSHQKPTFLKHELRWSYSRWYSIKWVVCSAKNMLPLIHEYVGVHVFIQQCQIRIVL